MGLRMGAASSRARRPLRFAARVLLIAAVALVGLSLVRWQATLNWLGNFLVCSDPLEPADLILVMGGDFWGPRVLKAAQLGAQGWAPLVLISGPPYHGSPEGKGRPEGELAVEFLVKQGYPPKLFAVFAHDQLSTLGEVLALHRELARRGASHVIVVTSSYHSRRCAILFRLFCPGVRFLAAPAPDPHYHADRWWTDPSSHHLFFSEWSKIFGSVLVSYPSYWITHWGGQRS